MALHRRRRHTRLPTPLTRELDPSQSALNVVPHHTERVSSREAEHLVSLLDGLLLDHKQQLPHSFKAMIERLRVDLARAADAAREHDLAAIRKACGDIKELASQLTAELKGDTPIVRATPAKENLLSEVFEGRLQDIDDSRLHEDFGHDLTFQANIPQLRDIAAIIGPQWGSVYWTVVVALGAHDDEVREAQAEMEAGAAVRSLRDLARSITEQALVDEAPADRGEAAAVVLSVLPS